MSFDELPSDAQPPHTSAGDEAATERETSASDAPPAAAPRRRRAQRTGTDAAPPESAVEGEAPIRRRTPGKKTDAPIQAAQNDAGEPDAPAEQATKGQGAAAQTDRPVEAVGATPEPQAKPARRRRAAQTDVEPAPPATPDAVMPEPAAESGKPRRQTRRKPAPEAEIAAARPAVQDGASEDETPAAKPARRRSIRTPKEAAPDASANAAPADAQAIAENARIADAQAQAEADAILAADAPSDDAPSDTPAADAVTSSDASLEAPAQSAAPTEDAADVNLSEDASADTAQGTPDTDAEAGPEQPGAEQAASPEADAPERRGRQRTSRNRRRSPNGAASPDASASTRAETGQADTEPAAKPPRPPRSRLNAPATNEATAAPDTDAEDGDSAEEQGADMESADGAEPRGRRRRNRRNNRKRGDNRAVTAEAAAPANADAAPDIEISAAIVADLTAEAVAPPAPLPVEELVPPIDLAVGAHLIPRSGIPQIHINGKAFAPVLFFGNMEGTRNAQRVTTEVRRAAQAGVHLHSVLVELPCPLSEASYVLDEIDLRLRALLDADPDGFVMPRLVFVPARGWKREYPTEISAYAEGTTGDPSLTSARFWQECERSLDMLITHIQSQTYGERVWGYHLERGEWFQSADGGYDRSTANRDAFRDWLREKYRHSLILLRAAWYEGDVQFHTAEIPAAPGKPNPQRAFYDTRRERNVIDFNEFTSESTANRLTSLARAVKKASNYNALVSVCYGYTLEFGHGFSGHLALDRLLASPYIDLITGPPSYRDRKPTGAASFPAPIDSPLLHGKLWLSEDDTKTYLAPAAQDPDDFNPRLADRFATEQAQERSMGRALATNTGVGWMDLWGEGWLDDESLWERIGAFTAHIGSQQAGERPRTPDVIALIDEKSLLHIQKGEPFFRKLTNGLRDTLQRSGAAYGIYLQSDVLSPDFPTDARLYLFLTPFRLTAEQRAAIKTKLQRDNKTLAWLYAPGACEERPTGSTGMEEVAAGVVGITLRPQAWNSEVGSRILDAGHPLTERLGTRDLGTRERLNPSFYVDDPGATVLAEYQGSGLPSLAVRNLGNWKSVFVGDPTLPLELLRGICRYANVPLYAAAGEDIVTVGNGWITIHATRDGQRTLRLPASQALYDLSERRVVAEDTREYRYFLRAGATRIFCAGTRARFAALGLPNLNAPAPARSEAERDDTPPTARPERPMREPRERGGRDFSGRSQERSPERGRGEAQEAVAQEALQQEALQQEAAQAENAGTDSPAPVVAPSETLPDPAFSAAAAEQTPADDPQREAGRFDDPLAAMPFVAAPPASFGASAQIVEAPSVEEEAEPYIEPFPEPRRVSAPASPSRASASLRADLETLKAVLEMEMPADAEEADGPPRPVAPPLPLPKEGVPGLEAILSGDSANRRRRRRGGRGRGRRPGEEDGDETDGPSSGSDNDTEDTGGDAQAYGETEAE